MSTNWSQGGQPSMQNNGGHQSQGVSERRNTNPPPVCFNCGVEGHFLVACPEPNRATPAAFPPAPAPYQYAGAAPPAQAYPPLAGPPQSQYPPYQPIQQYGAPAPQYSYNQPPQSYNAPSAGPQYSRPYQPSPYPQYPQPTGPPQFSNPGYHTHQPQFAPPATPIYQSPANPYPPQNPGYGNFQAPSAPYQSPQPQWNNAPPMSRPPLPRQQRSDSSYQREYSGTPSQNSQQQQSQQRTEQVSEPPQKTPQTPSSNYGNNHQDPRQGSHNSPAVPRNESKPSSRASTPYGRHGSTAGIANQDSKPAQTGSGSQDQDDLDKPEEGEVGETDEEEDQFNWDYKFIFKEPERAETVALAQPLSASFKSTPVPLVQAWTMKVPSISRYARKENLKEFVRSIRHAPQWSYLQEDPAFSDADLDGPSIPLNELPAWTAARHGTTSTHEADDLMERSRKRARSAEPYEGEDEQEDIDNQIKHEAASDTEVEYPPSKRQKNEEAEADQDQLMGTPTAMTPIIGSGRAGTPCLATVDDAWAPQPGEGASTPQDPTEALLASLGVSGSPKPVKQESLPPYLTPSEERYPSPQSSQPPTNSQRDPSAPPPTVQQGNGPPINNGYADNSQGPPHHGLPTSASYANGMPSNPPYGNAPPPNVPPANQQYIPSPNPPYVNGPPANFANGNPQYGPPINGPYGNVPHNGFNQQVPPQWGPPRSNSYSNPPPSNAPQGYPQYAPPNVPYGNPPYGPAPNPPYGNAPAPYYPQGPPQYMPPRNPSFGNGPPVPGPYGAPTQTSPTQYGPPNGPYTTGQYPHQPQAQYNNDLVGPYGHSQPPNAPYPNGPSQPIYGNGPNGNVPPRQDSGYMSARGSYSNASGPNEFNNQKSQQNPAQQHPPTEPQTPNQGVIHNQQEQVPPEESTRKRTASEDSSSGGTQGTPLSPTSAEILGKLVRKSSNAKSADATPQKEATRKVKRPQPVVAEAYSRRW